MQSTIDGGGGCTQVGESKVKAEGPKFYSKTNGRWAVSQGQNEKQKKGFLFPLQLSEPMWVSRQCVEVKNTFLYLQNREIPHTTKDGGRFWARL